MQRFASLTVAGGVLFVCAAVFALAQSSLSYTAPEKYTPPATAATALAPAAHATLIFGGDMMLDRTVRTFVERSGEEALFTCLDRIVPSADYVVTNLEGPITSNGSRSVGSAVGSPENYIFTFPSSTAALLRRHGVSAVALGNNHILNFGNEGLQSTIASLEEEGVAFFGEPYGHHVAHVRIQDIPFSFIGYNEFDPAGWRVAASTTVEQLQAAVTAGSVPIVFAHWGQEYTSTTALQRSLAQTFAHSGARLIVGAHPHIVQDHEYIGATPVYYSLGNLVFDQYWNESVRTGLLLSATFSSDGGLQVREIPIRIGPGGRPCPVE